MAIHQNAKQSDTEKRLKLLEYQLYGKKEKLDNQTSNFEPQNLSSNVQHPTSTSDVTYLRKDLTKIFILASIAIAAEGLLYFGGIFKIFENILI